MFTFRLPKIYRFLEYAIVLIALAIIWQAFYPHATHAQDSASSQDFRSLFLRLAEKETYFRLDVEPPVAGRSILYIRQLDFQLVDIGTDYACLVHVDALQQEHCFLLTSIRSISYD